jgi:histidinol dehydrogenase
MIRLDATDPAFESAFAALVDARRDSDQDISRDVTAILERVRGEGDMAVAALTERFDGHRLDWAIPLADCHAALAGIEPGLRSALELAHARVSDYHVRQRPADSRWTDATGVTMGARWTAVESAGLYVPGGRAAYPSSVLMNAIPAKVAGVDRVVMVTPTPGGVANPLVLAAAALAGVDEVWRIGGAQAVGALAYGTARIAPVDVIVGPGNAWVAEAKRQLYGRVGIDMVAGPSEILVVADATNDPAWIAADLMSQAEHDPTSQSILITDDPVFADAVISEIDRLTREWATARQSWDAHGAIILVEHLADAVPLIDRLAPEHLELAISEPELMFDEIRHAGSVFLGRFTPEAIGDYLGGPNHVLPTGRRARFSSGLSVTDFMKRTSFLSATEPALRAIGPAAVALARAEGLPAHAESVRVRL